MIPAPAAQGLRHRNQIDAIDGAGFDTEVTPGTFIGNHGVHLFGGADNGIDRAGLDALGAAYALVFADEGDLFDGRRRFAIQWQWLDAQQVGQILDGGVATRNTFV